MKKAVKIIALIASVGILGFLGLTLFVVDSLPGPAEIARAIKPAKAMPATTKTEVSAVAKDQLQAEEAPDTVKEKTTQLEKGQAEKVILSFLDEDAADIRVCDQLGESKLFNKNSKMKDLTFDDMFKDNKRSDAIAESLRIPIRSIFQDEHVSSILKDVMEVDPSTLNKEEKSSFLTKINFYSRAAFTAAHLYERKRDFEELGDRAIHLSVIARIAALRPELADSPALRGACEDLQKSIGHGDMANIKDERKAVLDLIKESGLTPEQLDFNPEAYLDFRVKFTKDSFTFTLDSKDKT